MSEIKVEGIMETVASLEKMMTSDDGFRRRVQGAIRQILQDVRKGVSNSAREALGNDPRHSYKAVRTGVYRKILGGQVNILDGKGQDGSVSGRAGSSSKSVGRGRGGNRWGRSERTNKVDGYEGKKRGFILRFHNNGAGDSGGRRIHSYTGKDGKSHSLKSGRNGNRGSIRAKNWFGPASQRSMELASGRLQHLIDMIIQGEFI